MKGQTVQQTRLNRGWMSRRRTSRGLTLVELMVSIVLSMVVVLAATLIYLSTRATQRALDEASAAHESGAFALKLIGRELMNAGFYPAVRFESADLSNVLNGYADITGRPAYASGLFGCDGAGFVPSTGTCGASTAGASDALVIGYFTSDAFGTSVGQRADCQGNDVAAATVNVPRVGGGSANQPPAQPLFVANHYQLTAAENASIDGRTVQVRSLACNGNGAGSDVFASVVSGIDDLQLTYGVYADDSELPVAFYTAPQVTALGNLVINGKSTAPWARVVAVRVCVIGRTFQSAVATRPGAGVLRYEGCNGALVDQPANDLSLRKTYVQVFGLRNRQTYTY